MDNAKNQENQIKIVIMGMENAGKTTIVNVLTKETDKNPNSPPDMTPTRAVKRNLISLFQTNTVVWDFGGQEIYRNEYMSNPELYFHTISLFYYVVDIQDYYRLMSSTMYFMGVFQLIRKYSPDAKIIFLFHKMDPNFDPKLKNLKEKFLAKIEPHLKTNKIPLLIYDTTIFDLNSITIAFNQEI